MEFLLQNHHWYSLFKVHWLVIISLLIIFYYRKVQNSRIYETKATHLVSFYTAVSLLALVKATPLDVLGSHYLFSAHVLQGSVIYFVIIPLFILSFPVTFYRQYLWNHRIKFLLTILAHPWLTLFTFNGLLTLYYIPFIFNVIQTSPLLMGIAQIILAAAAFFTWWVIIQPLPELKNFDFLLRAVYIFLASVLLMPIGFFYLIKLEAHFPIYITVAQKIIPILTPIYDQQLAGGILKITQMFSYALALLFIMFSWAKDEQKIAGQANDEHIRYVRGVVVHLPKRDDDK